MSFYYFSKFNRIYIWKTNLSKSHSAWNKVWHVKLTSLCLYVCLVLTTPSVCLVHLTVSYYTHTCVSCVCACMCEMLRILRTWRKNLSLPLCMKETFFLHVHAQNRRDLVCFWLLYTFTFTHTYIHTFAAAAVTCSESFFTKPTNHWKSHPQYCACTRNIMLNVILLLCLVQYIYNFFFVIVVLCRNTLKRIGKLFVTK